MRVVGLRPRRAIFFPVLARAGAFHWRRDKITHGDPVMKKVNGAENGGVIRAKVNGLDDVNAASRPFCPWSETTNIEYPSGLFLKEIFGRRTSYDSKHLIRQL